MIHFFEFVYIELTLAIAEPSYTVAEDVGVLSVSVTVTGETDITVTGRYVTFRFLQSGYNCTENPLLCKKLATLHCHLESTTFLCIYIVRLIYLFVE